MATILIEKVALATRSFEELRTIPESEWTEGCAIIIAQCAIRGDVNPMQFIPVKLRTPKVWLAAFAAHPELYYEDVVTNNVASYDFYLKACARNPFINLQYIPDEMRTSELYLTAIRGIIKTENWGELEGFLEQVPAEYQTEEIVELMVLDTASYASNLEFVAKQTTTLCKTVLVDYPQNLWMVREQTPKLCVFAINSALSHYLGSTKRFPETIRSIHSRDEDFYISILEQLSWKDAEDFLRYSHVQTRALCLMAFDLDQDCAGVIRSAVTRRWLTRTIVARDTLPLLGVGLSTLLLTEIFDILQEIHFPMKTCRYAERKLSPTQLWDLLLVCCKRIASLH